MNQHDSERIAGLLEADGLSQAASLEEALGPLLRPRYVIPRYADDVCETWLSTLMPELLARYFRKRNRRMAMLHAVPSALAKNRELAEIYARYWNAHVSPGQPLYAYQGEGQRLVEEARRDGHLPESKVRDKEVFL